MANWVGKGYTQNEPQRSHGGLLAWLFFVPSLKIISDVQYITSYSDESPDNHRQTERPYKDFRSGGEVQEEEQERATSAQIGSYNEALVSFHQCGCCPPEHILFCLFLVHGSILF